MVRVESSRVHAQDDPLEAGRCCERLAGVEQLLEPVGCARTGTRRAELDEAGAAAGLAAGAAVADRHGREPVVVVQENRVAELLRLAGQDLPLQVEPGEDRDRQSADRLQRIGRERRDLGGDGVTGFDISGVRKRGQNP